MKKVLFILFISLLQATCFSQSPDTIRDERSHRLTYDEFQSQYGTDDTSAALIDLFFSKRNEKAFGQMSMLPLSTAVTLVIPPVGVYLVAISSTIFINGIIVQSRYSRKKLLVALNDYHSSRLLSDNFRKKVNTLLDLSAENEKDEYLEKLKAEITKNDVTSN